MTQRAAGNIDLAIEQKSFAIMDTLLQFSQVVERLQDAPADFEAFDGLEDDLHTNIYPNGISPRPTSEHEVDTFPEME
ncbi:voltage-gated ion channel superfamily [Phytophthora cinnamomi]|uniref:voltage-gated ion channel superfamily n=1 Tax=Phytophthora cinnamomi TaxID=4785 RepID=UPI003559A898|nr:voltage-gated ion channel superfamily [Phytophthora cinnamomi]